MKLLKFLSISGLATFSVFTVLSLNSNVMAEGYDDSWEKELDRELNQMERDLDKMSENLEKQGKRNEVIVNSSVCGKKIKGDVENSVIKQEIIINGKKVKCYDSKNVNLGVDIESGSKIKNSIIKSKVRIKNSVIKSYSK